MRQGVMQGWKVLDERGKILTRKTQQAGRAQGADRRSAAAVTECANFAKVIACSKRSHPVIPPIQTLEHLDLARCDHIEASAKLTLPHDRFARTEAEGHDRVAAPDR